MQNFGMGGGSNLYRFPRKGRGGGSREVQLWSQC